MNVLGYLFILYPGRKVYPDFHGTSQSVSVFSHTQLLEENAQFTYTYELIYRAQEEETAIGDILAPTDSEDSDTELPRAGDNWWCHCSKCAPMETQEEWLCCSKFHRGQFLLNEDANAKMLKDI